MCLLYYFSNHICDLNHIFFWSYVYWPLTYDTEFKDVLLSANLITLPQSIYFFWDSVTASLARNCSASPPLKAVDASQRGANIFTFLSFYCEIQKNIKCYYVKAFQNLKRFKSIKSTLFGLAKCLKSSSHVCDLQICKQSSRFLLLNVISYYEVNRFL